MKFKNLRSILKQKSESERIKMAGCDTGFIDIDETWNQATALRKYSSHKSWYSKFIVKVQNLKDLNDKAYDSRVEENLNANLTKAENTAACLGQISHYLTQIKYEKWEDHAKEVQEMDAEVAALWKEVSTKAHVRNQSAARRNVAPQAAPREENTAGAMKLVAELKPEVLSHDATAGELRIWLKKFEAYYHASNMQVARIQVQQAYLRNCLDNSLALQLDSTIQQTTPVIGGGVTCVTCLAAIFKRKYPPLLRRKQFFSMSQQPGQDERAFLESLKAAASEADVGGMTLQDALCMMLVAGIRDTRLKEKLSELEEPSLPAFTTLIDAHLHAKATAGATASVNKVYTPNNAGKKNQRNQGQKQGGQVSEAEKKRRTVMKGKCYRCGSGDHMANSCSVAKEVKCRSCNATGHIATACTPTANVRAVEGESGQGNTLALEYQPDRDKQQQQTQQKAQVNYVQTYPTLQAAYPNRNTGQYYSLPQQQQNTANINAVFTQAERKNEETSIVQSKVSESAVSHEDFVKNQKEATAAYAQAQTRAIHNKPTPPLLL